MKLISSRDAVNEKKAKQLSNYSNLAKRGKENKNTRSNGCLRDFYTILTCAFVEFVFKMDENHINKRAIHGPRHRTMMNEREREKERAGSK